MFPWSPLLFYRSGYRLPAPAPLPPAEPLHWLDDHNGHAHPQPVAWYGVVSGVVVYGVVIPDADT